MTKWAKERFLYIKMLKFAHAQTNAWATHAQATHARTSYARTHESHESREIVGAFTDNFKLIR